MVRSDAVINAYLLFCKCILVTPYSFFVDVIHYAFIPLYSRRMIFLWIFCRFFLSHSGTQHVCNCYVRVKAFLFVSLVFNLRAFFFPMSFGSFVILCIVCMFNFISHLLLALFNIIAIFNNPAAHDSFIVALHTLGSMKNARNFDKT